VYPAESARLALEAELVRAASRPERAVHDGWPPGTVSLVQPYSGACAVGVQNAQIQAAAQRLAPAANASPPTPERVPGENGFMDKLGRASRVTHISIATHIQRESKAARKPRVVPSTQSLLTV
jgi:hypothetical protein